MDGVVQPGAKNTRDGRELQKSVQSATQSQQLKTMDDAKKTLENGSKASNSTQEIAIKKNLQQSRSEKGEKLQKNSSPRA